MTIPQKSQTLFVPAMILILAVAAVIFRPLLPIDETRYMTVAWEMWLRGDWLAPLTVNFEPYHHKPPMLFWLINASWSVFGVSRWAALVPVALASTLFIVLTRALAKKLFNADELRAETLPVLTLGSIPFLIYGTLMMFDVTLSVFVLSALLALVSYAEKQKPIYLLSLALALGLGVLTKGPVAWLYVIFPVLLAPYWMPERKKWASWYAGCALAFVLSTIPVLLWLIPVLKATNPDFAFWLVWEQTAGRITGNMENSHSRPLYFYLPLLPVLFLPWLFLPSFWTNIKGVKNSLKTSMGLRFIAAWVIPVILAFSLISGKQPHYLVPLLPGVLIFIATQIHTSKRTLLVITLSVIAAALGAQGIASQTIFKKYDLQPIAGYMDRHRDKDWAFVRKYQGELTFLGRLTTKLDDQQTGTVKEWLKAHPEGMAVIRYSEPEDIAKLHMVMSMPYRGKNIGIFTLNTKKDKP